MLQEQIHEPCRRDQGTGCGPILSCTGAGKASPAIREQEALEPSGELDPDSFEGDVGPRGRPDFVGSGWRDGVGMPS